MHFWSFYVWLIIHSFTIALQAFPFLLRYICGYLKGTLLSLLLDVMGPIKYNHSYYWVHLMCKKLFMLWMIVSQTSQYSMQPNFFILVIIQAMIVTESQIPKCGSKIYCWSFNTPKKKVTCVRENSWNLCKHFDMSVRTKQWHICGSNLEWHTNWPKLM